MYQIFLYGQCDQFNFFISLRFFLFVKFYTSFLIISFLGIAFAVILKHFVPNGVELSQFNPRMAKNNLRIVIESYANAGLDLSAVINVNETASKDWVLKAARF